MDARASTTVMNIVFAMAILIGFFLLRRRLLKLHEMSELGRPLLAKYVGSLSSHSVSSGNAIDRKH